MSAVIIKQEYVHAALVKRMEGLMGESKNLYLTSENVPPNGLMFSLQSTEPAFIQLRVVVTAALAVKRDT